MTDADRGKFAAQMLVLAEVYGRTVTEPVAEIYFKTLGAYSLEDLEAAVEEHVKTGRFFPVPAELLELCQRRRRALAEGAKMAALPTGPPSEADRQVAKTAMAEIRELIGRATQAMSRRLGRPVVVPDAPTAADLAALEERKRQALADARAKGFQG